MNRANQTDRARPDGARPDLVSVGVGLLAVAAPASLTGLPIVDAVERVVLVGGLAFIGAHGRRWSWLTASLLVALGARDLSLAIALAGLALAVAAAVPKRRGRVLGAAALGFSANAVLWYPEASVPLGPVLALVGFGLTTMSGLHYMRNRKRKVAHLALIGIGAYVVLAAIGLAISLGMAVTKVEDGANASRDALRAARNGDADAATGHLRRAGASFDDASSQVSSPLTLPARLVPGVAQQLHAVQATVDEGSRITATADDIVATADYDRLQYDGQVDLDQVIALREPTAKADTTLRTASANVDEIREGALLPMLRTRLDDFADQIDEASRTTSMAADLLEVAPALLGGEGDRRYLVMIQASSELRGAGGFIGSFAELTAVDGDVQLTRSGRIRELIEAAEPGTRTISGPEDYLDRYGRFRPEDFLQDVSFSPNFPSSAMVFAELYGQSGGLPVDGVISADPTGLAALLKLTGPVSVDGLGEPLSAKNAERILNRDQYIAYPESSERGEVLTEATRVIFDELVSGKLPAPRKLAEALSPAARAGHLRMWSPTEREQETMERLGADGTLAIPAGHDGFSVVQQNAGNNKLDAYLKRSISYRPRIDAATGELTATMRIELTNDVPSLDLPDVVIGNSRAAPDGTNVTWMTIHTPHAVTAATIDGVPVLLGPSREAGINAWDTPLINIGPGKTVVVEVELAGGVDLRDGYDLTVLPQPTAIADRFTISTDLVGSSAGSDGLVTFVTKAPIREPIRRHVGLSD